MYLSINDIRKKPTNKSKVEINVRKKKYGIVKIQRHTTTKLDLQLGYRNSKPKLKRAIYVRFETVWFLITIG